MSQRYKQPTLASAVRFEKAPLAELEFSKMKVAPRTYTTFNAGDIVPVRVIEVLPHTNIKLSADVISRCLSPFIVPVMDNMQMDIFAFFSSIREVNDSWKNVLGENTSGFWQAPEVELVPLYALNKTVDVQIPVGSIADYYGLPTQAPIKAEVLHNMNDTIFRQYFSIYNEYFRSENYQSPIPTPKLNVYMGYLERPTSNGLRISFVADGSAVLDNENASPTGDFGIDSISKALLGSSGAEFTSGTTIKMRNITDSRYGVLNKPLKANKLHDPFTSVLPSPQKGAEIFFGIASEAPVHITTKEDIEQFSLPVKFKFENLATYNGKVNLNASLNGNVGDVSVLYGSIDNGASGTNTGSVIGSNLTGIAELSNATGVSINELRRAAAIQQVYEQLARGGSRYREFLRSFFGLNIENPFKDIPTQLGHMRIDLDMYQVAQTSATVEGETAQGNLTAYSFTNKKDYLFNYTALEHGYIHILAVVRQKNTYSTFVNPYWFRRSTLDWYLPQLANIGEQPIRLATLNPFNSDSMEKVIGYQEAWYEYRHELDMCTGYCRSGLSQTLGSWTYADNFDIEFDVVNGDWLVSNAQEVLDRCLQVTSDVAPQFIACYTFDIEKEIPMPTYSVPGLDII